MMKSSIIKVLILCMIAALSSGFSWNNDKEADMVVYGTIYTAEDENNGMAEAFAVKDGKYVYVGDKEGAKAFIKNGKTEVIDRTGQGLIIPGCTEGHGHYFSGSGLNTQLPGCKCNYNEVLKILKEQVETKGIKQFVSFGWNAYELNEQRKAGFNFAEEIEAVAPGIPVVLIDNSGHGAVCNTTALKMAGILENPVVRGGKIELDSNGKPSGYIGDQVVYYVLEKTIRRPLSDQQYKNACVYAVNRLHELGYTNALDAFSNMYDPTALFEAIKKMDDDGELKINVASCYTIHSFDADNYQAKVDEVVDIAKNYSGSHFNPGYIKLFSDGVVEAGTGWIFGEYKHAQPGKEHGNIIWTQDELNKLVHYANSKGITVHTHAYGDAACNAIINAYIDSNKADNTQYRNCLAHVRNIKKEDAIRAAQNKLTVAANLIWHTDFNENIPAEMEIRNDMIANIGEEMFYGGYPMKSLLDDGVIVSSSTDAPAAESVVGSIVNILEVAATGIEPHKNAKPFAEKELISVREGLKALTINGAYQLGLEKERGSVKVGKYADFVILDKNILDYKGEQLRTIGDTKILNTYFEGENVYTAK